MTKSPCGEERASLASLYDPEDVTAYWTHGEWQTTSIVDAVATATRARQDELAVASISGSLTHGELTVASDRLALGLLNAGLAPGDAIIFQAGNEIDTVVAWYGVLKAGLRPVCSIPNHRLHEVVQIARASGARAHLFQAGYRSYDLAALSDQLVEACPQVAVRVVVRGEARADVLSMADLIEASPADEARRIVAEVQQRVRPDDIALFQLSGGTTGVPKVIPHSHLSYLSAARRWARNLEWNEETVTLHFLPIMHHAGLCTALLPVHLVGGGFVACRTLDAEMIEQLIRRYGVSWLHFNLAAFEPLRELVGRRPCDFSSITHFSWTFIRPDMSREAEELLDAVAVGSFGMGEGVHLSARRNDPPEVRRFTVGSTIGADDVAKVLEPGSETELPDGELGELCFKGPSVIKGYYGAPEVDATSFTTDGLLRSGDLGRVQVINGRRCLTVEGRLKDQISRGGEKFMASELEVLLAEHPEVREVAAVGMPDPRLGERVAVFVVPVDLAAPRDAGALREELTAYLDHRQVAKYKWPEHLQFIEELPRTAIGKVRKDDLRTLLRADTTAAAPTAKE